MTARPKNGSWMADFTASAKRYREFGFPSKTEAEAWELEARAALMRGAPVPVPAHVTAQRRPEHTIGALHRHVETVHWAGLKGAKELARNGYLFVEFCGEDMPCSEALSTAQVQRYVAHLREGAKTTGGQRSNGTLNRRQAGVSVLAKHAVDLGYISTAPRLKWQRSKPGRVRWFTEEEENTILASCQQRSKERERDLFIVLADTGGRLGEVHGAKWDDFGPGFRTVTFQKTKNDMKRTIVLTQRAREAITRRRADPRCKAGPFLNIRYNSLRELWDSLRTQYDWLSDAVIHTYRHTCASRLAQRGRTLLEISHWLGHRSLRSTMIYSHLCEGNMEQMAAVLEQRGPGSALGQSATTI